MVYKWSGYNYSVPAQIVGEELEKLKQKKSEFTSQDVVDMARSKNSKLHPLFEWDDKKAAEMLRNQQATTILHCLVTVPDDDERPTTRAYVCITPLRSREKGKFAAIKEAMENAQTKEVVLKNALAELMAFKRKYSTLEELSKVIVAIDELENETA